MISQLKQYIHNHAKSWQMEFRIQDQLTPLFRFNKEANGIVEKEKIGVVIFWFFKEESNPCLVTKIMDSSLSEEYLKSCAKHQQEINKKIGVPIFPVIYDIAKICGYPVVFQETINVPTYEMELSRATYGPSGNLSILKQVIKRHFKEMSFLFNQLQMIDVVKESIQYGDWAYSVGKDFINNYGLTLEFLREDHLEKMRIELNSMSFQKNYVLGDHYSANYFRGPKVVDQLDQSIFRRMHIEPGIVDVFRFIIAYFRTSPLNAVYKDWLDAIAYSIMDKNGLTITGTAIRGLLREIGLDVEEPQKIWALVMVSFFLRAIDEFTFHQHNIFVLSHLRTHFTQMTKRLIEIQDLIEKERDWDFSSILRFEESFIPPTTVTTAYNIGHHPYLIEEGYKGFNIIFYEDKYYGLTQALGPTDLPQIEGGGILNEYQKCHKCVIGNSLDEAKNLIDEVVRKNPRWWASRIKQRLRKIIKRTVGKRGKQ